MSSTESSGAPAEATAPPPAPEAAFPAFGSTRGSGLARGKRPAAGPAASTAAATEYTPTAIEVVNAPREYQNPFAPAEEPAAASPAPSAAGLAKADAPVSATLAPAQSDEPVALNILEPAQPKAVPAQTWESEGFKPAREPRADRAPREDRQERPTDEPVDIASIPEQFLYVRPGHAYVPTPRNFGGAPRDRSERPERPAHGSPERAMEASSAHAPAKAGGFFGWLKALFGGAPSRAPAVSGANGEHRHEGSHRRHRGGRNRGGQGGGEGGQRRDRGGRGRSGGGDRGGSPGGYRGERSEGSRQGGV
ncbi:MAG: hypothetical protein HYX71_01825 [Opitutae bacterium]|nr:hypothetical protein [Opitutae bacterium]